MKDFNLIVVGLSFYLTVGLNPVTASGQASFDDNLMGQGNNMPTLNNNQGEGLRGPQGMMQRGGGQRQGPQGMMQRRGGQRQGPQGMGQRRGGQRRGPQGMMQRRGR